MIIHKDDGIHRDNAIQKPQVTHGASITPHIKVTFTASGKMLVVGAGDITKVTTDVIVNAANSKLQHEGGVAKAISDAGEPIQILFSS